MILQFFFQILILKLLILWNYYEKNFDELKEKDEFVIKNNDLISYEEEIIIKNYKNYFLNYYNFNVPKK